MSNVCAADVRAVAVIGAAGHGKTALASALSNIAESTSTETSPSDPPKQEPFAGSYTAAVALQPHIALIDTPGHPDLVSDTDAAVQICDAALVVIDAVEGVLAHTRRLLSIVGRHKVQPILVIIGIERLFLGSSLGDDVVFTALTTVVDDANNVLEQSGVKLDPLQTIFAAVEEGWAFQLEDFARLYTKRFSLGVQDLACKLWGAHFYDEQWQKWVRRQNERLLIERSEYRKQWSGWLLIESTSEMRFRRYWFVIEKDNLSWYRAPEYFGNFSAQAPGHTGMVTIGGEGYTLDVDHDTVADIIQPHAVVLLPVAKSCGEIHNDARQPIVIAGEDSDTISAFACKFAAAEEFVRRRALRLSGGLDDKLPRRSFCEFVVEPLRKLREAAERGRPAEIACLAKRIGLDSTNNHSSAVQHSGSSLLRHTMQSWLPLSPVIIKAIKCCTCRTYEVRDPKVQDIQVGESCVCVQGTRLVNLTICRTAILVRILQGTLRIGSILRVPNSVACVTVKNIWPHKYSGSGVITGTDMTLLQSAPKGSLVLIEADNLELTLATCPCLLVGNGLESGSDTDRASKPVHTNVMGVALKSSLGTKEHLYNAAHRETLISPGACCEPADDHSEWDVLIRGRGELQLFTILSRLKCKDVNGERTQFESSDVWVDLREGVQQKGKRVVSASLNSQCWVTMSAEPISKSLDSVIKSASGPEDTTLQQNLQMLGSKWRATTSLIGDLTSANILVDARHPQDGNIVSHSDVVKQLSQMVGVLCAEPFHGIVFTLYSLDILSDTTTECGDTTPSGADLSEALRRAVHAASIAAQPCIFQPMYDAEILCCSENDVPGVYSVVSRCGGRIIHEKQDPISPRYTILALLPVATSFAVQKAMAEETNRSATIQCDFSGQWERVIGDPMAMDCPDATCTSLVQTARVRFGLPAQIPQLASLTDIRDGPLREHQPAETCLPTQILSTTTAAQDTSSSESKSTRKSRIPLPYCTPEPRNIHREPEARAMIEQAQQLERQGGIDTAMEAMKLWRKAFALCPQLEEAPWLSF